LSHLEGDPSSFIVQLLLDDVELYQKKKSRNQTTAYKFLQPHRLYVKLTGLYANRRGRDRRDDDSSPPGETTRKASTVTYACLENGHQLDHAAAVAIPYTISGACWYTPMSPPDPPRFPSRMASRPAVPAGRGRACMHATRSRIQLPSRILTCRHAFYFQQMMHGHEALKR
jgi:hypothetical protein